MRALDGLGLGDGLRRTAARPTHRISRVWDTGEETSRLAMATTAEERYGSPQLTMHRADLLAVLEAALPEEMLSLGRRVVGLTESDDVVTLAFADGSTEEADVVVGADGIHSAVRAAILGADKPVFTGVVAFRAVVLSRALSAELASPAEALQVYEDTRRERTARIQVDSRGNEWLKDSGTGDWVYGYDAWTVPLTPVPGSH